MKPADLALDVCKIANQDSRDYINGSKIETGLDWLPDEHQKENLSFNLTRGLQMRFALMLPYKEHWSQVL